MKTIAIMCQHPMIVTPEHIIRYVAILRLFNFPNFSRVSSTSIFDDLYSLRSRYVVYCVQFVRLLAAQNGDWSLGEHRPVAGATCCVAEIFALVMDLHRRFSIFDRKPQ